MRPRPVVASVSAVLLVLASCGGGGTPALSEADFLDELADICKDTGNDLDRLDEPDDLDGIEKLSDDATEILNDARDRLNALATPADYAGDIRKLIGVVDDELEALGELAKAAKDGDEAEVETVLGQLGELDDEQTSIGEDLEVPECINDGADPGQDPAVTDPATTVPETAPPTAAPLTLPPTLPPQTTPETAPAPVSGEPLFDVVDLTTLFVAPDGFTLQHVDRAAAQGFIDILAGTPALNEGLQEMGVALILDESDRAIATIVLGVAIADAMPPEWKDILCGGVGVLRTSGSGYIGIYCPGEPGTGVSEIFTMSEGDFGVSVASLFPDVPADLVADAFFEANP